MSDLFGETGERVLRFAVVLRNIAVVAAIAITATAIGCAFIGPAEGE